MHVFMQRVSCDMSLRTRLYVRVYARVEMDGGYASVSPALVAQSQRPKQNAIVPFFDNFLKINASVFVLLLIVI